MIPQRTTVTKMSEESYPQCQPNGKRHMTMEQFVKYAKVLAEDWGNQSEIQLPESFTITWIDPNEDNDVGKAAYIAHTSNHPTIHCNRFPSWEELSQAERDKWNEDSQ